MWNLLLANCLSVCLPTCLLNLLYICLPFCLLICLSVHSFSHLSTCLTLCLLLYLPVGYSSTHLSPQLFTLRPACVLFPHWRAVSNKTCSIWLNIVYSIDIMRSRSRAVAIETVCCFGGGVTSWHHCLSYRITWKWKAEGREEERYFVIIYPDIVLTAVVDHSGNNYPFIINSSDH